jgi:hypothetical protein
MAKRNLRKRRYHTDTLATFRQHATPDDSQTDNARHGAGGAAPTGPAIAQATAAITKFRDDIAEALEADDDDLAADIASDGVDVCVDGVWWSVSDGPEGWSAFPVHLNHHGGTSFDGSEGAEVFLGRLDADTAVMVELLRTAERDDRHFPVVRGTDCGCAWL